MALGDAAQVGGTSDGDADMGVVQGMAGSSQVPAREVAEVEHWGNAAAAPVVLQAGKGAVGADVENPKMACRFHFLPASKELVTVEEGTGRSTCWEAEGESQVDSAADAMQLARCVRLGCPRAGSCVGDHTEKGKALAAAAGAEVSWQVVELVADVMGSADEVEVVFAPEAEPGIAQRTSDGEKRFH